jgi:S-adenosylmethionine hydrolase
VLSLAVPTDTDAYVIENEKYLRTPVSATFHGRDVFAPVAAHLALGLDPAGLGPICTGRTTLDWPEPRLEDGVLKGEVVHVDRFGNVFTNLDAAALRRLPSPPAELNAGGRAVPIVEFYGQTGTGGALALINSAGYLEIAVNGGDAAGDFGLGVGARVAVR